MLPEKLSCPICSAPSRYLYANNGHKGQYLCKVCDCLFNQKNRFLKEAVFRCPHCTRTLERIKERKGFNVYKCKNNNCSFYTRKLNQMTSEEKNRFKQDPQAFKVRYIYREFELNFDPLAKDSPVKPKVNLSRIYASPHTLGLILTYHVNYGLSARKTAALMYDVHQLKISHQTILNYANSVALITKPLLIITRTNYPTVFVVMRRIFVLRVNGIIYSFSLMQLKKLFCLTMFLLIGIHHLPLKRLVMC